MTHRDVDDGFGDWFRATWRPVLRAVIASGVAEAEAEEHVAEAFARALARWSRVRDVGNPAGWVYRVAMNAANRGWRRNRFEALVRARERAELVAPPGIPDPVWDVVAALPHRQRQAIILRYVVGLSQHEVAAWMGIRPGTVAASLHAARRSLRISVLELSEASND